MCVYHRADRVVKTVDILYSNKEMEQIIVALYCIGIVAWLVALIGSVYELFFED